MNVQPMYFGESAPRHLRGAVSLSSAVFTAFGVVLGQVVGLRYMELFLWKSVNLPLKNASNNVSRIRLLQQPSIVYL